MATRPNITGIHIQGGDTSKHGETVSLVAASIASLIQVAHDTRMDQSTIQVALQVLRDLSPGDANVNGTTFRECDITVEQPE